MTVLEAIQRGAEFLAQRGVDSPRLHSELLLACALKVPRLRLYLEFDRVLTEAEIHAARELVKRRSRREPLQHILGTVGFCGLELRVGPEALIPRPETELLAEAAVTFLSTLNSPPSTALDYGTGTGCLAILLAVRCPAAEVHALDVSAGALRLARQNAARHRPAERIRFYESDGFVGLPAGLTFDLIVANPPYIASAEIARLAPEVRDHDPRVALDGGTDGLDFYRRLAAEAQSLLRPGGRLALEFGDGQAEAVRQILEGQKWVVEWVQADYNGCARILAARAGV